MEKKYYDSHLTIKHILLATDNSDEVAAAEVYAIELAAYFKCKLGIIHIIEVTEEITKEHISFDEYALQHMHHMQNKMETRLGPLLQAKKTDTSFVVKMKEGTVAKTILNYAAYKEVDCLVVGSHGSSGYRNNSFGSAAYELIKKKTIPLFIIPRLGVFHKFNKVAMACKGNTSEIRLLDWLTKTLQFPISEVDLLHVTADDNVFELTQFKKELDDYFTKNKIVLQYINETNIDRALNRYCVKNKIELLVIAGKPKSFFQKLFSPNIVARLNYHIQLPLLYLPNYE